MTTDKFEFPLITASKRGFSRRRPVQGVGINDVEYSISYIGSDGKVKRCPYYMRWCSILNRCFSKDFHKKNPTYKEVTVCSEWLYLSNFRGWMEKQDWKGKELDKDIIIPDNQHYSPETCVFVDKRINLLLSTKTNNKGKYKRGVSQTKRGKFMSSCNDGTKGVCLGYFDTEEEAYSAYVHFKSDIIIRVADEQEDSRIREGLLLHASNLLSSL